MQVHVNAFMWKQVYSTMLVYVQVQCIHVGSCKLCVHRQCKRQRHIMTDYREDFMVSVQS